MRIAPSMLDADYTKLGDAVNIVAPVVDWLHLDPMDGHFVPNITFGPMMVKAIRSVTDRYLDCHLMISDPGQYLPAFAEAGANSCSVHFETGNTDQLIKQMRSLNLDVCLAVNPESDFASYQEFISAVDMILIMSIHPGFGGQSFMPEVLPKIEQTRKFIEGNGLNCLVEVDGGVNEKTIASASSAGANVFVAGSVLWRSSDPAAKVGELLQLAESTPYEAI